MSSEDFASRLHKSHKDHYFTSTYGEGEEFARKLLEENNVAVWLKKRICATIDPLLELFPDTSWLTIGDGQYGNDAYYLQRKGINALPTDISDDLLKQAKAIGRINAFRAENAESLTFPDGAFDFCLCKESYHHFPRPMLALYEMLRVAKTGVVLIEPNDGSIDASFMQKRFGWLKEKAKRRLRKNTVTNEFEETGNYVYRISKREMEKVAIGLNYKAIAFRNINTASLDGDRYQSAAAGNRFFAKIKMLIATQDLLCKIGLLQYGLLVSIIFKQDISDSVKTHLKGRGFDVVNLIRNPYLE